MRCCGRALDAAAEHGAGTLVLLDEPGASTEPQEGAAVAQAVVEELLSRGASAWSECPLGVAPWLATTTGSSERI